MVQFRKGSRRRHCCRGLVLHYPSPSSHSLGGAPATADATSLHIALKTKHCSPSARQKSASLGQLQHKEGNPKLKGRRSTEADGCDKPA